MIHYLEIPWNMHSRLRSKYSLKQMDGYLTYSGVLLPPELRVYASEDYSLSRWLEDESNATVMPTTGGNGDIANNRAISDEIVARFNDDQAGVILSLGMDSVVRSITGALLGMKVEGRARTLVVTHKSKVPLWRKRLRENAAVSDYHRILVVDYSLLSRLLTPPPSARLAQSSSEKVRITAQGGSPSVKWDFVVFDEAHLISSSWRIREESMSVASLNKHYDPESNPFVIFASAHLGYHPVAYEAMSQLLSDRLLGRIVLPRDWGSALESSGYSVAKRRELWRLSSGVTPDQVREECARFSRTLDSVVIREEARSSFTTMPMSLTGEEISAYQEHWGNFRSAISRGGDLASAVKAMETGVSIAARAHLADLALLLSSYSDLIVVRLPSLKSAEAVYQLLSKKKTVNSLLVHSYTEELPSGSRSTIAISYDDMDGKLLGDRRALFMAPSGTARKMVSNLVRVLDAGYATEVIIPYVEKSVEEEVASAAMGTKRIGVIYRRAGARRVPRGRLS